MTNFEEAKLMLNPIYITQVAENVCQGVCQYLDVQYIPREDFSAYPTLRRGNQGNKVLLLQYLLNRYGFYLTPDGIFGTRSYNAVVDFLRKNGLTVDGIVGKNTWSTLLNPQGKTIRLNDRNGTTWYLQQMLLSKLYPVGEIVAEQKAKQTYEYLMNLANGDESLLAPLRFLWQREVVHYQRFGEALETVKEYYNQKKYFC